MGVEPVACTRQTFLAIGANGNRVLSLEPKGEEKKKDINHLCASHGRSGRSISVLIRKTECAIVEERHAYEVRGLH